MGRALIYSAAATSGLDFQYLQAGVNQLLAPAKQVPFKSLRGADKYYITPHWYVAQRVQRGRVYGDGGLGAV